MASILALQLEVNSLSKVDIQNRQALDILFAQQGGLCAVLNEECCLFLEQARRNRTKCKQN